MRRHAAVVVAVLCALAALQCSSKKKTTHTPSSLSAIYNEQTIAALRSTGGIRVDRIARVEQSDGLTALFALGEYRLVQSGPSGRDADRAFARRRKPHRENRNDPRRFLRSALPVTTTYAQEFSVTGDSGVGDIYLCNNGKIFATVERSTLQDRNGPTPTECRKSTPSMFAAAVVTSRTCTLGSRRKKERRHTHRVPPYLLHAERTVT